MIEAGIAIIAFVAGWYLGLRWARSHQAAAARRLVFTADKPEPK